MSAYRQQLTVDRVNRIRSASSFARAKWPDLLAERMEWPLRGAGGGYDAARLEQNPKSSTTLGEIIDKDPRGAFAFTDPFTELDPCR